MRQVLGILLGAFLSAVLMPSLAQAEDFYWHISDNGGSQGATPYAACADRFAARGYTLDSVSYVTATKFACIGSTPPSSGNVTRYVYRYGDSCPPDTIYNSPNGSCDPDCSTTEGQVRAARGPDSVVTTDGEGVRSILPEPFDGACFDGCYYAIESTFSDKLSCALAYGSTDTGFCNYSVHGNGESCSANDGVPAAGGDPINEPEGPDPDSPEYACNLVPGYVWTGTQCVLDTRDDDDSGSGDGDGDGSGDGSTGGGGGGGGSTGGDGGDGSGDGSDGGDGDGSSGGGDDGEDPERKQLKKPTEQGTFDEAIAEYEDKIDEALAEVKAQAGQFGNLMENKLLFTLPTGNGPLPCNSIQMFGQTVSICLSSWLDELAILRNLILFVAAVISLYIIFREDK